MAREENIFICARGDSNSEKQIAAMINKTKSLKQLGMTREEEVDKIVEHLAGLYEHAENRDYRYNIPALLRMAIAWADEHPKKISTELDVFDQMTFDVNFPQFTKEACENCNGGMYAITWNILRNLIAQVAVRASELNDPVLNALMIKLNLYEMENKERRPTIKKLQEIFEGKEN